MVRRLAYNPNRYDRQTQIKRSRSYTVHGYKDWRDPYIMEHGTLPEKILYEQLSRRGINFYFLNDYTYRVSELDLVKEFQTDFILPDQKITIEVQGAYWHSKPATMEADAFKMAVYEAAGWHPLAWWDYDIIADINKLFREEPRLAGFGYIGVTKATELPVLSRKKQDTSQGIRTLNYKRGQRLSYRKKPVTIKKARQKGYKTYGTGIL